MKSHVDIIGFIDTGTVAYVHDRLTEPANDINILVSSDGGDLDAALDVYVTLLAHPARKTAFIQNASSAALFIAMAADHRISLPDAKILLHQSELAPPAGRWTARQHDGTAALLRRYDGEMASVLSFRTGTPPSVFAAAMEDEEHASIDWCLTHGIVHEKRNNNDHT